MRIIFNHQSVARRARWCSSVRFVARTSRPFAETHSRRFRFRRGRTRTLSLVLRMSMMDDVSVVMVMMAMATTANNTVFATVLLLLLFDA